MSGTNDALTGTWQLARIQWRTGWKGLLGWPAVIAGLVGSTVASLPHVYDTAEKRLVYQHTIGSSPTSLTLNGRGYALDTLAGISVYEMGFYMLLIFPVIAVHLAIRHSRSEEDHGRTELMTAAPLGRLAPLAAGMIVTCGALLLAGIGTAVSFIAAGTPSGGSFYFATILTMFLLSCAALGFLVAQLGSNARSAYAMALGALLITYIARAVIDGRALSATWLTPMGWLAEAQPFSENNLWPYLAMTALTLILVVATVMSRTRRDLGGGVFAERLGSADASRFLASSPALLWRLTRGGFLGWLVVTTVFGAALGAMAQEIQRVVQSNPTMQAYLGNIGSGTDALLSLNAVMMAMLATALGVQTVGRYAAEETSGRLGLTLAAPQPRGRWWWQATVIVLAQVTGVLAISGLTAGVAAAIATDDAAAIGRSTGAAIGYLPAVAVMVMASLLAFGVAARAWTVGWALLGFASVVYLLAATLQLPQWVRDLSPLQHIGAIPATDPQLVAISVLSAAALACVMVGWFQFRRRDLAAG